jgi:antirestriction protein ArdC
MTKKISQIEKVAKVQEDLTRAILEQMETNPTGWTKPWQGEGNMPHNPVTGSVYSGGNMMTLMWLSPDPSDSRWSTYDGWKRATGADPEMPCHVRKGETGVAITFVGSYKKNKETGKGARKGDDTSVGEWVAGKTFKVYVVFHASQVENAPEWNQPVVNDEIDTEVGREWFKTLGADWREAPGDMAYYMPSQDYISTPLDTQFHDAAGWFATVAHEHTHWTGHADRTGRSGEKRVEGRSAYAFEELVAELGAVFLCNQHGIAADPRPDHAKYLTSWIKALNDDRTFLWTAASKAGQAVKWMNDHAGSVQQAEVA